MDRGSAETSYVVKVENFEGPFDLLLYLVRNSKVNIRDLSISEITGQFIDTLKDARVQLEPVSEFIFTASHLLYLKSRILLPEEITLIDEATDERREYIENLIEYQKYRNAAEQLREGLSTGEVLQRNDSQLFIDFEDSENWQEISVVDLVLAFTRVASEVDKSLFRTVEMAVSYTHLTLPTN